MRCGVVVSPRPAMPRRLPTLPPLSLLAAASAAAAAPAAGATSALTAEQAAAAADLPEGWTVEFDDEGDAFYVHSSGRSSWFKPNPDGSVPEA